MIAQDVAATLATLGVSSDGIVQQDTPEAYMSLRYNDLFAPVIKSIQQLNAQAKLKDQEILALKNLVQTQQSQLNSLLKQEQEVIQSLQAQIAE